MISIAAGHRHLVQKSFGMDPLLNRREYVLTRAMQSTLEHLANSTDVYEHSASGALADFDDRRRVLTGQHFRLLIKHDTAQTIQQGIHNADLLLRKAGVKHLPLGAKAAPPPTPITSVRTPPGQKRWGTIVDQMADHTIDHFDRIADDLKGRLSVTLKEGFANGEGARDLSSRVQDALGIDNNRAAERARTLTMETYNQAHLVQYTDAGIPGTQVLAAEDERMCEICGDLDGTIFALDDPALLWPPFHNNCLLPETRCETPGGIVMGLRSRYNGPIFELTLTNGAQVTVTENHMLLTPHGFAAAKFLREGDDVLHCPNFEGVNFANPNNHGEPPAIKEIFKSLTKLPGMVTTRMPSTPEDLHGDARLGDGYVDVVMPNRLLRGALKPPGLQQFTANNLRTVDRIPDSFEGERTLTNLFIRLAATADGGMGGVRQSSAFFRRRLPHPEIHRLAATPRNDPSGCKASVNSGATHTELFGKSLNGLAGIIKTDQLVNINVHPFHGYVYDLQTVSSLLIGNSILMSNCRCTMLPVINALPEDVGQVSDDTRNFVNNWSDNYFDIPAFYARDVA